MVSKQTEWTVTKLDGSTLQGAPGGSRPTWNEAANIQRSMSNVRRIRSSGIEDDDETEAGYDIGTNSPVITGGLGEGRPTWNEAPDPPSLFDCGAG